MVIIVLMHRSAWMAGRDILPPSDARRRSRLPPATRALPRHPAARRRRTNHHAVALDRGLLAGDLQLRRRDHARRYARRPHGYVAKREPVAGLLEPYDLEPEFRVLHALSDDPLPSPPTPWFTRDPAVLERPFYVMSGLPGEVPIPAPTARRPRTVQRRRAPDARPRGRASARRAARRRLASPGARLPGRPGAGPRGGGARARALGDPHRAERAAPPIRHVTAALLWLRLTCRAATRRRSCTATIASAISSSRATATARVSPASSTGRWCTSAIRWKTSPGAPRRSGAPAPIFASALLPPDEMTAVYAAASGRAVDPTACASTTCSRS